MRNKSIIVVEEHNFACMFYIRNIKTKEIYSYASAVKWSGNKNRNYKILLWYWIKSNSISNQEKIQEKSRSSWQDDLIFGYIPFCVENKETCILQLIQTFFILITSF